MKPAYAVPTPGVSARDPNNEFAHLEGLDFVVAEESVRTQQTTLKREEAALADELKRAQAAKAVLLREIKRMRDEDGERHPAPPRTFVALSPTLTRLPVTAVHSL